MVKYSVTFLALFSLMVLSSCGDAGGGSSQSGDSNSASANFMTENLNNLNSMGDELAGIISPSGCTATGFPSGTFDFSNYTKITQSWPCALRANNGTGETVLGTVKYMSALMCAVESRLQLKLVQGVATVQTTILPATDSCFVGVSPGFTGSMSVRVTDEATSDMSSAWTQKVIVDFIEGLNSRRFYIFYKDEPTIKAIKASSGTTSSGTDNNDFVGIFLTKNLNNHTTYMDFYYQDLANTVSSFFRHYRAVIVAGNANYDSLVSFKGAYSYADNGGGYKGLRMDITNGAVEVRSTDCSTGLCTTVFNAPDSNFWTFDNSAQVLLTARFKSLSDTIPVFNTPLERQFLP